MQYTSKDSPLRTIDDESSIPFTESVLPYILAVDDNKAILSLVMSLLEGEGYSCVGISESERVLPFLQQMGKRGEQHLPALILLDLMMPKVSGYDIAGWLSEREPYNRIHILVITADARARDRSTVPGVDDYLFKPFQIDDLITKVEHYLLPLLNK